MVISAGKEGLDCFTVVYYILGMIIHPFFLIIVIVTDIIIAENHTSVKNKEDKFKHFCDHSATLHNVSFLKNHAYITDQ